VKNTIILLFFLAASCVSAKPFLSGPLDELISYFGEPVDTQQVGDETILGWRREGKEIQLNYTAGGSRSLVFEWKAGSECGDAVKKGEDLIKKFLTEAQIIDTKMDGYLKDDDPHRWVFTGTENRSFMVYYGCRSLEEEAPVITEPHEELIGFVTIILHPSYQPNKQLRRTGK